MNHYAWLLGLRSIVQHARRNLATGLAIGFGYLGLLLIIGYSVRVGNYFAASTIYLEQSGHISLFKKDGLRKRLIRPTRYSLSSQDLAHINSALKTFPGFDFSAPYLTGSGLIGNGCASYLFRARAFIPELEQKIHALPNLRAVVPKFNIIEQGEALWASPEIGQISLGIGLAKQLGKEQVLAAAMNSSSNLIDCKATHLPALLAQDNNVQLLTRSYDRRLSAVDARISSLFKTGLTLIDHQVAHMPLPLLQELLNTDSVSYLAVFLHEHENSARATANLVKHLQSLDLDFDAYAWNDVRLNPNYVNGMAVLDVSILFVAAIIIFVVLLSILNSLTIGLAESRREIGGLRALGYKPKQIAYIFAIESGMIALVSMGLAAALCIFIVKAIALQNIPFRLPGLTFATNFQITPEPGDFLRCAALIFILVVLTTLVKARSYARQHILSLLDPGS